MTTVAQAIGTGIGFDIVPAFRDPYRNDVYIIPDTSIGRWIDTNPRIHKEHSTAANERAGKLAKPLLKALKRWNALQSPEALRSFHIELMVYSALSGPPASYADGLVYLFADLAERVMRPCPDPAGLGPNVDGGYAPGRREQAQALLSRRAQINERSRRRSIPAGHVARPAPIRLAGWSRSRCVASRPV